MTRTGFSLPALLGAALLLAGCGAIGNKYDYADVRSDLSYKGRGTATVAVYDQREDVADDPDEEVRVGTQRNRLGIPFKVKTVSGLPLATEMSESFQRSLNGAGFEAMRVLVKPAESMDVAKQRLLTTKPRRALLLRLDEYESDTLKTPTLHFDITLTVYDMKGTRLAVKTLKGSEDLQGQFFGAARAARKSVPAAFEKKIGELLNAPEIVRVMQ